MNPDIKVEYVMSGLAMTRIAMKFEPYPFYPEYCDILANLTRSTTSRVKENGTSHPLLSCLYNGFTEASLGAKFADREKNGGDALYSDSGGLQMVTAGRSITPELKTKVYEAQSVADYGFCFDTIPLKRISAIRSKSERSTTGNKLFNYEDLESSARQTGIDIQEQLEYFERSGVSTKGIVIVQGNTYQDMVEWFDVIINTIPKSLWHRIAGIAVADTCMGNGQLETIEMTRAIRMIHDRHGEQFTKHVHLLGVGSLSRIKPTINLIRSGYIDFIERLSYDSTSHTSNAYMGKLFEDHGSFVKVSGLRTPNSEEIFTKIYNKHRGIFEPIVTVERYLDIIFSKTGKGVVETEGWDTSSIIRYMNEDNRQETALIRLIPYAYVLYSVENFMNNVDKMLFEKAKKTNPIELLSFVSTEDDMSKWFSNFSSSIDSSRIARQLNTIESFFED